MSELKINNIYKGDSLEILKTFPRKSIDLIFADPPYNMQLKNDYYGFRVHNYLLRVLSSYGIIGALPIYLLYELSACLVKK